MDPLRTRARFPGVPADSGHYESFYLKASDPAGGRAVWIRYTVHKRPGGPATGSVWLTVFDTAADGPWAVKQTLAPGELGAGEGEFLHVGASRMAPGSADGSLEVGGKAADWQISFDSGEPPFEHLPRGWMYRAPLPRTKLLSPYPDATFRGYVNAGGKRVEIEGWRGMIGHNWGSQHAERWVWMQGSALEGGPGHAWFDAAMGRIKLGPVTMPWIANGVVSLDGERFRVGGPERMRATRVNASPDRCDFLIPGEVLTVRGRVEPPARKDLVGWEYADPDGGRHNTLNCSIANLALELSRPGAPPRELSLRGAAAYELGMRETTHGIPIQPYADG